MIGKKGWVVRDRERRERMLRELEQQLFSPEQAARACRPPQPGGPLAGESSNIVARSLWKRRVSDALAAWIAPDKPYRIRWHEAVGWICERATGQVDTWWPQRNDGLPIVVTDGSDPNSLARTEDYTAAQHIKVETGWRTIGPPLFDTYDAALEWMTLFLAGPRTEVYFAAPADKPDEQSRKPKRRSPGGKG